MSLATRLSAVVPERSNRFGCATCAWLASLSEADRLAFNEWIDANRSLTQLWEIASSDPDHPLPVGVSAMRLHVRSCTPNES